MEPLRCFLHMQLSDVKLIKASVLAMDERCMGITQVHPSCRNVHLPIPCILFPTMSTFQNKTRGCALQQLPRMIEMDIQGMYLSYS